MCDRRSNSIDENADSFQKSNLHRRAFIGTLGAGSIATFAGCSGEVPDEVVEDVADEVEEDFLDDDSSDVEELPPLDEYSFVLSANLPMLFTDENDSPRPVDIDDYDTINPCIMNTQDTDFTGGKIVIPEIRGVRPNNAPERQGAFPVEITWWTEADAIDTVDIYFEIIPESPGYGYEAFLQVNQPEDSFELSQRLDEITDDPVDPVRVTFFPSDVQDFATQNFGFGARAQLRIDFSNSDVFAYDGEFTSEMPIVVDVEPIDALVQELFETADVMTELATASHENILDETGRGAGMSDYEDLLATAAQFYVLTEGEEEFVEDASLRQTLERGELTETVVNDGVMGINDIVQNEIDASTDDASGTCTDLDTYVSAAGPGITALRPESEYEFEE